MTIEELLKHINGIIREVRQTLEEARKEERTKENKNTHQKELEKLNKLIYFIDDLIKE